MPLLRVAKKQVATELLEQAVALYLRGDSYFACIHLAGAAEEILSVYARTLSVVPSYDRVKQEIVATGATRQGFDPRLEERAAVDLLNEAKNSVKHKRGSSDEWIECDPRSEAAELIVRAMNTLFSLREALELQVPAQAAQFMEAHNRHSAGEA